MVSENDRFHTYVETMDEDWIKVLLRTAKSRETTENTTIAMVQAVMITLLDNKKPYHDIVRIDPLVDIMLDLLPLRNYYIYTTIYRPNQMKKELGVYAGVSEDIEQCVRY